MSLYIEINAKYYSAKCDWKMDRVLKVTMGLTDDCSIDSEEGGYISVKSSIRKNREKKKKLLKRVWRSYQGGGSQEK